MTTTRKVRNEYAWDIDKNINYLFNIEKGTNPEIREKLVELADMLPKAKEIIEIANTIILQEIVESMYDQHVAACLLTFASQYKIEIKGNKFTIPMLNRSFNEAKTFTNNSNVLPRLVKIHSDREPIISPTLLNLDSVVSRIPEEYTHYREWVKLYLELIMHRQERGEYVDYIQEKGGPGIQATGNTPRFYKHYGSVVAKEYNSYNANIPGTNSEIKKRFYPYYHYYGEAALSYYPLSSLLTTGVIRSGLREISFSGIRFITNDVKFNILKKVITPTLFACSIYGLEAYLKPLRNTHTHMDILDDALSLRGFINTAVIEPIGISTVISKLSEVKEYATCLDIRRASYKALVKNDVDEIIFTKDRLKGFEDCSLLSRVLATSLAFPIS